ncbi:hypothetical protein BGZ83_009492 [Gryganskiella cystojenkinii]|nr:hypothetical protein BGZ83_009492 [Gryganskiella cystojenkinii]
MTNTEILPKATVAPSHVLAKAALAPASESTFKFLYFGLHGRGEMTRTLLNFGGAKFEEIPLQWPAMKPETRFGHVPVLFETTADGTVLELSETQAIERYLSRKFNLYGANAWEEHLVCEYTNSTEFLNLRFEKVVFAINDPELRQREAVTFYSDILPRWIQTHERHLAAEPQNQNGHYVGNAFTLADIRASVMLDRILFLIPEGQQEVVAKILNKETAPGLFKVREAVHSHPLMAAWYKSQRQAEINAGTKGFFKF